MGARGKAPQPRRVDRPSPASLGCPGWRARAPEPPLHPQGGHGGRGGAVAGARVRSRRTEAGMGSSRRQSPGRALGRRRAGGVRRGGVGGGGENRSWAIVSIKKRQSVPGRRLSALELLLGEERGGKEKEGKRNERRKSRRQDFRAGGFKSFSQCEFESKARRCVCLYRGGRLRRGRSASPPLPRAHKAGGVVRGRRPERVSARRRPPRPGRPPPAPAARDPLVAAAGSNSVHLLPPLPSLRRLTEPGTYRRTR